MVFSMGVPSEPDRPSPLSKSFPAGEFFRPDEWLFLFSQSPSGAEMVWRVLGFAIVCWGQVCRESTGPNADRSSSALRVCQWFHGHDRSPGWYQTRIGRLRPSIRMGLSRHRCLPKFFFDGQLEAFVQPVLKARINAYDSHLVQGMGEFMDEDVLRIIGVPGQTEQVFFSAAYGRPMIGSASSPALWFQKWQV